jgi:hypothetical protein
LSGGDARDSQCCERYQQSTDYVPNRRAMPKLSTAIVVHIILLVFVIGGPMILRVSVQTLAASHRFH